MEQNDVIKVIQNRVSLRNYAEKEISKEHLDLILDGAIAAPTAGNQMLYSIIVIKDEETKQKLSKTCDNQAFIAKAPVLLLFVADQRKWFEYYRQNGVVEFANEKGLLFEAPQESDFVLACEDTMAAAQNAVITAESLGIGSCYIGDILEHYEYHRDLFQLPDYVFPLALLCLGYYKEDYPRVHRKRFDKKFVVFEETYHCLTSQEYQEMFAEHEKTYSPQNPYGADNYAKMFYARKTGAAFSKEMARSVRVALKKWNGELY